MDSIAVTKPDMAVMKRDRLGLSLFGLLSLAFGDEVRTRSDWQTGLYREVPLDLLEEEEQQPVSGESPAVQLNVDLKVVLETLKKEQQHADQRQRKAAERILERVYLLERQVREHTPVPTQVNIQLGAPQAAVSAPFYKPVPCLRGRRMSGLFLSCSVHIQKSEYRGLPPQQLRPHARAPK